MPFGVPRGGMGRHCLQCNKVGTMGGILFTKVESGRLVLVVGRLSLGANGFLGGMGLLIWSDVGNAVSLWV